MNWITPNDQEWSRLICKVDPAELAAWIAAHPNNVTTFPISTHRDNYGMGGKKSGSRKNHFDIGRATEAKREQ